MSLTHTVQLISINIIINKSTPSPLTQNKYSLIHQSYEKNLNLRLNKSLQLRAAFSIKKETGNQQIQT